ncbi:FAD-dependent oxidoreductase [Frankia sp. CiP3]|uniref:FAD-dependent oxidoreductase n=1 Tax=Frankia sp. CiP3 TaxID=2880971 RepID=UPI001EF445E2|nr:FAD-binding protein [Frankia sp. CiP3]
MQSPGHRINRRVLLSGTAGAGGAAVLAGAAPAAAHVDPATGPTIGPADPRYALLTTGNNQRFVARPEYVRMIHSTEDAVSALRAAATAGKRVSVRSGGHCFTDLACNPDVQVILDFSDLNSVDYDPELGAFAIQPGARLINIYEKLYKGWGVALPAGVCYSVGAGGHVAGGGYGLLSRQHRLVVDHLYAVEVVTVDAGGRVRIVRATREPTDPNRELWWAHTGGGGGNFGLVTKYWFRSPDATGSSPAAQLMSPPSEVLFNAVAIRWADLDQAKFSRLMKNYGAWHEANSSPDSPYHYLSSIVNVGVRAAGGIGVITQVDATVSNADQLLTDYVAALNDGVGVQLYPQPAMPQFATARRLPWMRATRLIGTSNVTVNDPTLRAAHKSALIRRNFTDQQVAALYTRLTDPAYTNPRAMVFLFSYGGRINDVAPDATASAQRSSAFKMLFQNLWDDPGQDAVNLAWLRGLYADFFAATGGAPELDGQADGCYINYADADMADPTFNTSGVPWQTLYYKGNYARLQRAKRKWDPSNFFRHSLSIQP